MEKNNIKKQNSFVSEEEKTLNWDEIQNSFKKTFGSEIYNSWLQKISLVKEYNDYLIPCQVHIIQTQVANVTPSCIKCYSEIFKFLLE